MKELWEIVSATLHAELEDPYWEPQAQLLPGSQNLNKSTGWVEFDINLECPDFFTLKEGIKAVTEGYVDPDDPNPPTVDVYETEENDARRIDVTYYAKRSLKKATPEEIKMFDAGDLPLFYVRITLLVVKTPTGADRCPTLEETKDALNLN